MNPLHRAEFSITTNLNLQNSFGVIDQEDNVKLHVTVVQSDDDYGWFEIYDLKTGGNDWYAEGSLRIDDNELIDYDGVFDLPFFVKTQLREWGIKVD